MRSLPEFRYHAALLGAAAAAIELRPAIHRRFLFEIIHVRRCATAEAHLITPRLAMADTYTSLHYHIVFSTKNREPWLSETIRDRLWPYLGGIARENKMCAIEIGGVSDHVHALVRLSPSGIVSKAVQLIKGGSSLWIKTQFPNTVSFGWQDGYGAFTVSASHLDSVQQYIRHQAEHHRTISFVDEYRALLERNGVEIDERYWLG